MSIVSTISVSESWTLMDCFMFCRNLRSSTLIGLNKVVTRRMPKYFSISSSVISGSWIFLRLIRAFVDRTISSKTAYPEKKNLFNATHSFTKLEICKKLLTLTHAHWFLEILLLPPHSRRSWSSSSEISLVIWKSLAICGRNLNGPFALMNGLSTLSRLSRKTRPSNITFF